MSSDRPLTDARLVTLVRAGDERAFEEIHLRYRGALTGFAARHLGGSHADAEDVVQDAFARAHRALLADDRPLALRAWLYTIVKNRCLDLLRRPVRLTVEYTDDLHGHRRAAGSDPFDVVATRQSVAELVGDINRLPARQRVALVLGELEGCSHGEIAGEMGSTVPATKSLLHRAREGLTEAASARAHGFAA